MPNKPTINRTDEFSERESRWKEQKARRAAELTSRFGRKIFGFDTFGKPLGKGELAGEDITWSDVVVGLGRAVRATGDPLFIDAIECLRNYQLDKGEPQCSYARAYATVYGNYISSYLENMKFLIDNQPTIEWDRGRREEPTMTRESDLLESARAMVESSPGILGGTPVIRGTRVPVHDVGAWAKAGVPLREILDHYPSITDEQVHLSHIYADAYPAPSRTHRERPRDAELVAERTLPRIEG